MTVVIIIAIPFVGAYSVQSIDDLAYLVAMGIDVGDNNNMKVTFEFTRPNYSGEGAATEVAPTIINSVEASSIDSAITLMNTHISKEINLSHCKVIVFSEAFASQGISTQIYSLMNRSQIRPDTNVIVSKCPAKDFIENSQPSLENLVAKYYDIAPISSDYTGYTPNVSLGDFFDRLNCETCHPTAMLGSLNTGNSPTSSSSMDSSFASEKDSQTVAGSSSIESSNLSEMIGTAVFYLDTFVGELTAQETLYHLLIRNEIDSCNITIPNSFNSNEGIDLFLYNEKSPKIDIQIVNGSPFIHLTLNLEGHILSVNSNSQYDSEEKLTEVSVAASKHIDAVVTNYLYKTSRELKTDIDGFGKHGLTLFLTEPDFESYDWLRKYRDATFDVTVNVKVKSAFLLGGDE